MTRRGRLTVMGLTAIGFALGYHATHEGVTWLRGLAPLAPAASIAKGAPGTPPLPPVAAGPDPEPAASPAAGAPALATPAAEPAALAETAERARSLLGRLASLQLRPPSAAVPLPVPPAPPVVPGRVLDALPPTAREGLAAAPALAAGDVIAERVEAPTELTGVLGPLEVTYTLDPGLTARIAKLLRGGAVELAHVILLDPADGRVLSYVSTNPQAFPATRAYPMASLMKVVTAAAALRSAPAAVERPCVFEGSPYYLTARLVDPPARGHVSTFGRALAMSNNQCFAQIAVNDLGAPGVLAELDRLGVLEPPAPGHAAGEVDPVETRLDLGELGSGLAGSRLAPLAAARVAAALADGELVAPQWIERVTDANGVVLEMPAGAAPRRALDPDVTRELRSLLVETTVRGTARRAFRGPGGRPLLDAIPVAGKTGSLSGRNPDGHYEWFIGVAPADAPEVAIATLVVNRGKWRMNASMVAAESLKAYFCEGGRCRDAGGRRQRAEADRPSRRVRPPA